MTEKQANELGWFRAVWRNDGWFERWNGRGVDGAYLSEIEHD